MRQAALPYLVTGLIALAAGLCGAIVGSRLIKADAIPSVHEQVHRELGLSAAQNAQIDRLENVFQARRQSLEADLRLANRELAEAIVEERHYGPRVAKAVDHFHTTMGLLQKETLQHMFRMRDVLTPAQASRFDRIVAGALTAGAE